MKSLIFVLFLSNIYFQLNALENSSQEQRLSSWKAGLRKMDAQELFGYDAGSECEEPCLFGQKMQCMFPLKHSGETDEPSQLNIFNWKYITIFKEQFSIFSAQDQSKNKQAISDDPGIGKLTSAHYLNTILLQTVLLPCSYQLCGLGEFQKMYQRITGKPFIPDEQVVKTLGPEAATTCFMVIYDLLVVETYAYICNADKLQYFYMKMIMEEAVDQLPQPEYKLPVKFVQQGETQSKIVDSFLHIDSVKLRIDNQDSTFQEGSKAADYQPYLELQYDIDGYDPLAYHYPKRPFDDPKYAVGGELEGQEPPYEVEWIGNNKTAIEQELCIKVFKKMINEVQEVDMQPSNFCIYASEQGKELSYINSLIMAEMTSTRLIADNIRAKIFSAQAWLKECISDHCEESINAKNYLMMNVIYGIHHKAVKIERICRNLVQEGILLQDQCDQGKQNIIVNKIEEYCAKNKKCMAFIANEITSEHLSLIPDEKEHAFDYFNLYKEIDKANLERYTPEISDAPDVQDNLSPAAKEVLKVEKELGPAVDVEDQIKYFTNRPETFQIYQALGTLVEVFQGRTLSKLKRILEVCRPPPDQMRITRAIGLIPQLARFDPWLEYTGHFRDVQFAKDQD